MAVNFVGYDGFIDRYQHLAETCFLHLQGNNSTLLISAVGYSKTLVPRGQVIECYIPVLNLRVP
jgi:hypothetical protein